MTDVHQNKLGIKIEGDLDDLQIIEEASDSEDENGETSQAASNNTLRSISTDLGSISKKPVFGAVAVTNSENVHFGDKHIRIYSGPISIKQIVQSSSGIDNSAYQKTEVENVANSNHPSKEEKDVHQNKLGIKIEGDLDDLQIIEEASDSEDENGETSQAASNNTLRSISTDLGSISKKPVFGAVAVTNSENVHFGDKHIRIYSGPISIKQIVQSSSGIDNSAYQKTEVENVANSNHPSKEEKVSKYKLQTWHKLACLAVGVVLLCCVCAVVLLVQDYRHQPSATNTDDFDSDGNSKQGEVMGLCDKNIQLLCVVTLAVVLITLVMTSSFLMNNKPIVVYGEKGHVDAVKIIHRSKSKDSSTLKADKLLISPNHLRIVSRTDWLAQPVEKPLDIIRQPVPWVIITHTATESCHSQSKCVLAVRLMQTFHIESKCWYDIGYNFLLGGDGSAYYARGWDYEGAHTKFFNKYSISIAFIGTFNKEVPPKQQLNACKKLIKLGVEEGKLAKDYKLFAHRQLMSTLSPGDALFDIIKEWPHFVSNYTSDMIPNY